MLLLGDLGNGSQGTSLLPAALYSGGATRGCENCSFSLFFSSAMTLTNPSLKCLLLIFFATGLEEIRIFKGLAFSDVPSPPKGAEGGNSVSGQAGLEAWAPQTLSVRWQVHVA